jgi:hypothetical protein
MVFQKKSSTTQSPLHRVEEHLKLSFETPFDVRAALESVHRIDLHMLPIGAYRDAERFSNALDRPKASLSEATDFLKKVAKHLKNTHQAWLDVMSTGELAPKFTNLHADFLDHAKKYRIRLAKLKLRYLNSKFHFKNTISAPNGRKLLTELVRFGVITVKEKNEFSDFAKKNLKPADGFDPNTYLQHLSSILGVHSLEQNRINGLSIDALKQIVP